jgi:epoxyqueuosine reductase
MSASRTRAGEPSIAEAAGADGASLRSELLALARSAGLDEVGVCSAIPFVEARRTLEARHEAGLSGGMAFTYRNPARSTDPSATLPGARSLIVGALHYDAEVPPRPPHSARVARYATEDHYARLRGALGEVKAALRRHGHRAVVVADDNALVDRAVAVRAGIGWAGKSSNVLLPGRGSWFVLGSVITDAVLEPTGAPIDDGCGSCRRCLDGCPTGAIVAPGVVDAGRCLAWHLQMTGDFPREHRVALGDRIYGCDECQEVCPPTRRAERHSPGGDTSTGTREAEPGSWVDLRWLLSARDDELLDGLGRWYVPRRDPRYLRRNALVVLGNTADPQDPWVVEALERHLDCGDELLVRHATWAAMQLGLGEWLRHTGRAARDVVAAEMALHPRGTAPPGGPLDVPAVPTPTKMSAP